MRAFCTVSAPLEVCASSAEQLSPGSRFLALRLLGQPQPKTLYFLVDAKSRVREVYTQTCLHFATQGMQDTELFGLAVLIDGEYMFADPESKLSKYGPKSWRSSHTHGLDANGRPLLELHFRVQFYIESSSMLKDETSRHNYYLQLRHNVLQRELARDQADQALVLLAGLALQADLGDAPSPAGIPSTTTTTTTATLPGTTTGGGGSSNNQPKEEEERGRMGASAMTTTLPKIRKRLSSYNERMLRLSSYVSSSSSANAKREAAAAPLPPTIGPCSSSSSSSASSSSCAAASASSTVDYFRQEDYLPPSLHTARAKRALRACHREHQGLTPAEAELLYIQHACSLHETINAHTFRMRLAKSETGAGSAWFVIYAKGIKILGASNTSTEPETTFLWPNITKLSFERKKFEIRSGESRITLYAASDEKNKLLLTLCKDTHQWSMKLAARLKEVSKRQEAAEAEEAESHCLHASYACSRSLLLPYKSKNEQRISVISSTSSNTTSGIVSDRVHSEDELEIMINTPPAPLAAPSTESLALAHLLDRPSVSRQTSSVGQMSLKDLEEQLAALSVSVRPSVSSEVAPPQTASSCMPSSTTNDSSTATDSPSSQHNIGSQCSSTCSTVVVTTPPAPAAPSATAVVHSTSSSLELGFSHTAQNSTLSESHPEDDDDDFLPSAGNGVYTLAPPTETSGVYTMHSSELTGQSSELAESEKSSHYGIFQPSKIDVPSDAVDGGGAGGASAVDKSNEFRLRSDSNISTSSSFRGDGSDPTNNQHKLLSADELTNLIVGRGSYPSRPAVSSTMHSDCDYVTLSPHLDEIEVGEASEVPPAPPPPPPYNARHEKTGLCGPPLANPQQPQQQQQQETVIAPSPSPPPPAIPPVPKPVSIAVPPVPVPVAAPPPRRRDPPPYPTALKPRPTSLICGSSQSEEITARFITTRPQISILKAHTSLLPDGAKPSYAAPTHYSSSNSNYASGSQLSLHHPQQQQQQQQQPPHHSQVQHHQAQHHQPHHAQHHSAHHYHRHSGSTAIGIPLVPYGLHHKSSASMAPPPPAAPQQACVLLPVIKPRQYLPPPPPSLPRQPPPPPPPGIYGSQLARNQMELYQRQLYSDVDYVIYPIQDPAVSQQEYLDAKQSALLAHLAYPAGWDTCKGHAIYRSTPYLPLALSTHSRYASTQNLSDTYVQLPGATYSPLYSPSLASLCSQSFEPPPPPPLHPARSRSDDNLLNSFDSLPMPKVSKRLPPPPPPPYVNRRKKPPMPAPSEQPPPIPSKPNHNVVSSSSGLCLLPPKKPLTLNPHGANSPLLKTSSGAQWAGERPKPDMGLGMSRNGNNSNSILAQLQASVAAASAAAQKAQQPPNQLDIALLREKSKHLDLPLISALCNDRSLLKQTKMTGAGSGAGGGGQGTGTGQVGGGPVQGGGGGVLGTGGVSGTGSGTGAGVTASNHSHSTMNSSTGTLSKARKSNTGTVSHRHPQDKLPPLPVQLAEANNYVMDPALILKHHKSYNSQSQN